MYGVMQSVSHSQRLRKVVPCRWATSPPSNLLSIVYMTRVVLVYNVQSRSSAFMHVRYIIGFLSPATDQTVIDKENQQLFIKKCVKRSLIRRGSEWRATLRL